MSKFWLVSVKLTWLGSPLCLLQPSKLEFTAKTVIPDHEERIECSVWGIQQWAFLISVGENVCTCMNHAPLGHVPLSACRSDYGPWLRVTVCRLSCTASLILSINELSSTLLPRTPSINHNLSSVLRSPHPPSCPPLFLPLFLHLPYKHTPVLPAPFSIFLICVFSSLPPKLPT